MKHLLLALALIPVLTSCQKDDPKFIGGKGGSTVLILSPKHHTRYIDSCTIYVKYNTKDAPSGGYDDSMVCSNFGAKPTATFSNLKKGDYYLYGYGYDTLIHQNVKGGFGYSITADATSIPLDVPVTEGD